VTGALAPEVFARKDVQLVIDEGHEAGERVLIAVAEVKEQTADLGGIRDCHEASRLGVAGGGCAAKVRRRAAGRHVMRGCVPVCRLSR
jgi:hypothetical protein